MITTVTDKPKCASEQGSAKGNRQPKTLMHGQPGLLERGWAKDSGERARRLVQAYGPKVLGGK